jgi:hypothetical protein
MLEQGSRKFAGLADAKFIWLSIFFVGESIRRLLDIFYSKFIGIVNK